MDSVTNLKHSLASSLKWLVRPKGSAVRGHGNVVRLLVGSVKTERACNARGPSHIHTRARGGGGGGGGGVVVRPGSIRVYAQRRAPGGAYFSLLSFTLFCSPYHRPLVSVWSLGPCSSPREEVSEVLSIREP